MILDYSYPRFRPVSGPQSLDYSNTRPAVDPDEFPIVLVRISMSPSDAGRPWSAILTPNFSQFRAFKNPVSTFCAAASAATKADAGRVSRARTTFMFVSSMTERCRACNSAIPQFCHFDDVVAFQISIKSEALSSNCRIAGPAPRSESFLFTLRLHSGLKQTRTLNRESQNRSLHPTNKGSLRGFAAAEH